MSGVTTQVATRVESHSLPTVEERGWPPPQGQWTYEDWLRLPDDGWQYEVIEGVLYMVPAPTTIHQRISRELQWHMLNFIKQHHLGEVFDAPTDVYLPDQDTPVQPDLLFIVTGRAHLISERGINGAPDLVVEILSPKTWWQDRRVKVPLYEEAGVQECWVVDPDASAIEVYVLRGQTYELLGRWGMGEVIHSEVLERFEMAVDAVFSSMP